MRSCEVAMIWPDVMPFLKSIKIQLFIGFMVDGVGRSPKTEKSREIARNISGKYGIPTSETFPKKNQVIWSSIPSTSHIITTSRSSHEEISIKKRKVFHVVGNTSHVGVQLFCISKRWNRSPMLRIQFCCRPVGFTEQADPTPKQKGWKPKQSKKDHWQ